MNSLHLQKITKEVNENEQILKNVNLLFVEGKKYCIFGPSGCGKTTLLNIISGIDENYTGGTFYNDINIKDIESIEPNSYKRYIVSYIKQDNILFENLSANENINIPLIGSKTYEFKKKERKVKNLSGGQYKKISIEQSLNKDAKILLVDEPTSNLDKINSELVMNLLIEHCKDKILIFVTHDKEIAYKYADEIIELSDGKCKRNYKRKIKGEEFTLNKPPHVKGTNKKKLSSLFFKRNQEFTNLFNQNMICLLVSFSLLIAIYFGIKQFFYNQLEISEELTYISLKQPNFYGNIDENDIKLFKEITGQANFKQKFKSENTIEITICNIPLIVNSEIIAYPNEIYTKELSEDTIILKCNDMYKEYFDNYLGSVTFDDYLEINTNYLMINYNNEIKEFEILDVLFDSKVQNITIMHSDPEFYKLFWSEKDEYIWTIDKDFLTKDLIEYINMSKNYFLIEYSNYYEIYKTDNELLETKKLDSISENNILVFNDGQFILHEESGIYYFNDLKASKDSKTNEGIIYYTPYKNTLELGRFAVESNEITISTVLADELGIIEPGLIKLEHNNRSEYYFVTGIFEANGRYIYQTPKWINQFNESMCENELKFKSLNCVLFVNPTKASNIIKQLHDSYPNAYIYSPVTETLTILETTINRILSVGLIFIFILFIIALFAIFLISKVEIESMKKPIDHTASMGYDKKDFNGIFSRILCRRTFYSFVLSQFLSILMILLTNNIMKEQMGLEDNILTYNILIPLSLLLICSFIVIVVYNILKYRKRKPKV